MRCFRRTYTGFVCTRVAARASRPGQLARDASLSARLIVKEFELEAHSSMGVSRPLELEAREFRSFLRTYILEHACKSQHADPTRLHAAANMEKWVFPVGSSVCLADAHHTHNGIAKRLFKLKP